MNFSIESIRNSLALHTATNITGAKSQFTPSAVLVPLLLKNGELELLYTKRANKLKHHNGEVSFPGGRLDDSDQNMLACALRETYEEIGIPEDKIEILGQLNETPVISQYKVTPFVGLIPADFEFVENKDEIDCIFTVKIRDLLNPDVHSLQISSWMGETNAIHYYTAWKEPIWGATGRITTNFLEVCLNYIPPKLAEFRKQYKLGTYEG